MISESMKIQKHITQLIKKDGIGAAIPSERKLCINFNVCRDTVRRAIKPFVNEGVLVARRGIGTRVNPDYFKEKGVFTNKSHAIGLMAYSPQVKQDLENDAYLKTITTSLLHFFSAQHEPSAHLVVLPPQLSEIFAAEEIRNLDISGLIWVSPEEKHRPLICNLREQDIPVVTVNRAFKAENIPCVYSDNRTGGAMAAEHLLNLGHKQTIILGKDLSSSFVSERCEGFSAEFIRQGLPEPVSLCISPETKGEDFCRQATALLKAHKHSAVFVPNIYYYALVTHLLREMGKKIPEDCSVLVYDKPPLEIYPGLKFTAVKQNFDRMGRLAGEVILNIVSKQNISLVCQQVPPELEAGNTCCSKVT
ncbi:MAG: LacI family DNA-binding transcriptional regulator [Planctomycetota bacterium]|jgi:DNA-binding LacI/PurR family transcriptional regulator